MKVTCRLAEEKDAPLCAEWLQSTPKNLLDPDIAKYRNLRTLAIEEEEPVLFVPSHPVLLVESLAHKPGISPMQNARALRKAQDVLEAMARHYGMAEIYWQCADETLIKFAERHGYTVITTKFLKKKVSPDA